MVQIRCDRCDKSIELDAAVVGQKVTCPHCGDVNVIRSAVPQQAPDRAAQAGYPPAQGPEAPVMTVRPALARSRPLSFFLAIIILLAGAVGGIMLASTGAGMPLALVCGGAAVVAIGIILYWKILSLSEGLKITTKRLVDTEGLFSKATSEVLHADIKNVQVRQTFWQRIWGVGTLAVSTAAENEDEIEIPGVPDPGKVRSIIDLYRPL